MTDAPQAPNPSSPAGAQPQTPLLVLIGFMGAGKTTLARMLSAELGCALIDLDDEIARIHGPIPELFATRGESGFRAIEHNELDRVLTASVRPAVLALGGGAFLQEANRQLLEGNSATVIFLDAPFEVLHERIRGTAHERPLAADPERLRSLYELRRPTYLLAHHVVDTSSGDPAALLTTLVQLAHQHGVSAPARVKL